MSIAPPRSTLSRRRQGIALALALALLVVQTLGLMHRMAHVDRPHVEQSSWLDPLFASHEAGSHECDAFDQAAHADFAAGATLDLAAPPPADDAGGVHPAWHIAAQAQGFLARAPPTVA